MCVHIVSGMGVFFAVFLGRFPKKAWEKVCFCKGPWLPIPEIGAVSLLPDRGGSGDCMKWGGRWVGGTESPHFL